MNHLPAGSPPQHRDGHNNNNNHHHNRCVLLFDMDCFYAQCERVRLGLPLDVKLCLFQWNSVLAVTYPAREHGIKRGDSWDDVAAKSKSKTKQTKPTENNCNNYRNNSTKSTHTNDSETNGGGTEARGFYTIHLPILGHDDADVGGGAAEHGNNNNNNNTAGDENEKDDSIEASYKRVFELSREEQLRCRRTENGTRRFHHQGKACLERYRLASMRIFAVVLESLRNRVTEQNGYSFVLERASIDEFYLDLTEYCYRQNRQQQQQQQQQHGNHETGGGRATEGLSLLGGDDDEKQTVVAGRGNNGNERATDNPVEIALNRAREVSHWIRKDVWKILGFTMSAGISTNKTMAKLAASYGKPNGQAVLYPKWFPNVLAETKITKVRNFGGKLGKTVLKLLLEYRQKEEQAWQTSTTTRPNDADSLEMLRSEATMADLNQIPLPFLLQSGSLSNESARFVFSAGRGIDHEAVKETSGALVKSITAFKSFTATKSHADIFDRWLSILAKEIVDRVARDTTRNKRYPRSCTLNYTYYTTSNGHRPSTTKGSSTSSTRSQRQSRSIRLSYPSEREGSQHQKSASLLARAKAKLVPIVRDHPLRGVGLSVSNFAESSSGGQQKAACTVSIQSFFASTTKNLAVSSSSLPPPPRTNNAEQGTSEDRGKVTADKPTGIIGFSTNNNDNDNTGDWTGGSSGASKPIRVAPTKRGRTECLGTECFPLSPSSQSNLDPIQASMVANPGTNRHDLQRILTNSEALTNKDLDYARKLQASFDRENYALSTANRRRQSVSSGKKTRRIDYFFRKR